VKRHVVQSCGQFGQNVSWSVIGIVCEDCPCQGHDGFDCIYRVHGLRSCIEGKTYFVSCYGWPLRRDVFSAVLCRVLCDKVVGRATPHESFLVSVIVVQCQRAWHCRRRIGTVEFRPGHVGRLLHLVAAVWDVGVALSDGHRLVSVRRTALRARLRVVEIS